MPKLLATPRDRSCCPSPAPAQGARQGARQGALGALSALGALWMTLACGGAFEPTPDIPEHIEYDTVRLEYGEDDGLPVRGEPGMRQQAMVGQPSPLAQLTLETVRFTNQLLYDQLKLIEDIKQHSPTRIQDDAWIWETQPSRDEYLRFEIRPLDPAQAPGPSADRVAQAHAYLLYLGKNKQDHALVYSAEFYQFERGRGLRNAQQGYGVTRFFMDEVARYRPQEKSRGTLRMAFRSRLGVRQVRVSFAGVPERVGQDTLNTLYQYAQLRDGQGRLSYIGRGDYSDDGPPYEQLAAHAAWTRDQQGHIAASVSGGSLTQIDRLLLRECWDTRGLKTYGRSQPRLPDYEGGSLEDCAIPLQGVELSPPEPQPLGDVDPPVPPAHPQE